MNNQKADELPSANTEPNKKATVETQNTLKVSEPTPVPWKYKMDSRGIYIYSETDPDSAGGEIAEIFRFHNEPLAEANAKRIVQCVNAFDDLLAAARAVLQSGSHIPSLMDCPGFAAALQRTRLAIAKAEGDLQ